MKCILIGAMILAGIVPRPFYKQQAKPDASKHDAPAQQQPQQSAPPKVTASQQEAPRDQSQTSQQAWGWHDAFAPPSWPNWALVIVGIGATIAALKTLSAIKRQGLSMKRQTTILRNSLAASIATERAWVMVEIEANSAGVSILDGLSGSGKSTTGRLACPILCICTNYGKTPARIIEKRIGVLVADSMRSLPPEPDLNSAKVFDAEPSYLAAGAFSKRDCEVEGFKTGITSFYVIYGVVRYRHMFSDDIVQTTFGYKVIDNEGIFERLTGCPEYNKHT